MRRGTSTSSLGNVDGDLTSGSTVTAMMLWCVGHEATTAARQATSWHSCGAGLQTAARRDTASNCARRHRQPRRTVLNISLRTCRRRRHPKGPGDPKLAVSRSEVMHKHSSNGLNHVHSQAREALCLVHSHQNMLRCCELSLSVMDRRPHKMSRRVCMRRGRRRTLMNPLHRCASRE